MCGSRPASFQIHFPYPPCSTSQGITSPGLLCRLPLGQVYSVRGTGAREKGEKSERSCLPHSALGSISSLAEAGVLCRPESPSLHSPNSCRAARPTLILSDGSSLWNVIIPPVVSPQFLPIPGWPHTSGCSVSFSVTYAESSLYQ